jgi:hypothetical protein
MPYFVLISYNLKMQHLPLLHLETVPNCQNGKPLIKGAQKSY